MTDQPDLLSWTPPKPLPVEGETYDAARDEKRLGKQAQKLFDVMKDGSWYTPEELEKLTGENWASLSARARDFRKPKFGIRGTVERESLGGGLFRYRLALTA